MPIPTIRKTVWVLAPMVVALALAMDVYVPAIPSMLTLFHVSAGEMQLTLSLFMFTCGIIQLIIGPLSDQYGRRPISYLSILIFTLGTVLCASAQSAPQLIIYRMVQATGAIGMTVTALAVVRDRYHGEANGKTYSYLNGIIAFSPMLAPFVGSYLDVSYGWQATFLVLLLISLWAFLSIMLGVPETLAKEHRIKISSHIFREYKNIFLNRIFLYYTLSTAMGLSYLFFLFFVPFHLTSLSGCCIFLNCIMAIILPLWGFHLLLVVYYPVIWSENSVFIKPLY